MSEQGGQLKSSEQRDFLVEARKIIAGDTMLLPQREHLMALNARYAESMLALHVHLDGLIGHMEVLSVISRELREDIT